MIHPDTIKLLKECDAGVKMAVSSIDEILEKVTDSNMKALLQKSKDCHKSLGEETELLLKESNSEEKDPNPMAVSMSWIKTNVKMGMNSSDKTVADLITDGCDMGIKSLYRYMNQYQAASDQSKKICNALITIEEDLRKDLRSYL